MAIFTFFLSRCTTFFLQTDANEELLSAVGSFSHVFLTKKKSPFGTLVGVLLSPKTRLPDLGQFGNINISTTWPNTVATPQILRRLWTTRTVPASL